MTASKQDASSLTRAASSGDRVAQETAAGRGRKSDAFRFGRVPYGSYGDMYRDHQALLEYLSGALQHEIDLQLFANYADMVRAIRESNLELAWLGPLAYLAAEDAMTDKGHVRIVPLVKPQRYGKSQYASEIIVRADSKIDTLTDLKTRSMAFVDTESTSGYLLAAAYLMKSGISEKDPLLCRGHFVHQYGNVVLAVLFGKYDAGAVFEGAPAIFLKGREKNRRDELRVLARSESVPYEPIAAVVGERLTDSMAAQIQSLFLNLGQNADILKKLQVEGFVPATAAEYNSIRAIVRTVERIHPGT